MIYRYYSKPELYEKFYSLLFSEKVSVFSGEDESENNKLLNDMKNYITVSLESINIDENNITRPDKNNAVVISDNLTKNIGYINKKIEELNHLYMTLIGWEHIERFEEGLLIFFKEYLKKDKIVFLLKTLFVLNEYLRKEENAKFIILDKNISNNTFEGEDIWMRRKGF